MSSVSISRATLCFSHSCVHEDHVKTPEFYWPHPRNAILNKVNTNPEKMRAPGDCDAGSCLF